MKITVVGKKTEQAAEEGVEITVVEKKVE